MPTPLIPEGRRSKRTVVKKRASVIVQHGGQHQRIPCLILDSSPDGFRLRGSTRFRRGQVVEVILDEDPMDVLHCSVVWVGKRGSQNEGDVGLQVVSG